MDYSNYSIDFFYLSRYFSHFLIYKTRKLLVLLKVMIIKNVLNFDVTIIRKNIYMKKST